MEVDIKHTIRLISLTLLLLFINTAFTAQTLKVKIHNKTGYRVDSLIISTKFIGTIENDSLSEAIPFEKFNLDSGSPNEGIFGIIGEKRLKNVWLSWCGSSQRVEYNGEFTFELGIQYIEDNEYLQLH